MLKRIFALFCAVMLMCGAVCFAQAEQEYRYNGFTYILEKGDAVITGCTLSDAQPLVFPAQLDGYDVSGIDLLTTYDAQYDIPSIVIEDGIESVNFSYFTFSGCTQVEIPNSVKVIEAGPFVNFPDLQAINVAQDNPVYASIDGVLFEKKTKTLVYYPCGLEDADYAVPEGIVAIGENAFFLASVHVLSLPESLVSIHPSNINHWWVSEIRVSPDHEIFGVVDGALYEKPTKTLLYLFGGTQTGVYEIPAGTQAIGPSGLGCQNLHTVRIPADVTQIDANAFVRCSWLTAIETAADNPVYESIDGVLFEKNGALVCCPIALTSAPGMDQYEIPQGTTEIGEFAFSYCSALSEIVIPDGVTQIGDYAFCGCASLTGIEIPSTVTSIGEGAFSYCSALSEIVIPDGVTSIGDYAFSYCSGLESVVLPDSLTYIAPTAFIGCENAVFTVGRNSYARQFAAENGFAYTYADVNDWLYN